MLNPSREFETETVVNLINCLCDCSKDPDKELLYILSLFFYVFKISPLSLSLSLVLVLAFCFKLFVLNVCCSVFFYLSQQSCPTVGQLI